MKNIFVLNKKEGETPLEALEAFRSKNKKYQNVKMTYAGRLDPMASGLLLVLSGEEIKSKEEYLALNKEYKFEVLFGFATDTYDILGKVASSNTLTNFRMKNSSTEFALKIKKNIKYFTGKFMQKYPLYSSKTIKKAREGVNIETESRAVNVKSVKFLELRKISSKKLLQNIEKRIAKVKGDFRQAEIIKIWRRELQKSNDKFKNKFFVAYFYIKCGSGTYIRSIANDLGRKMKVPALALAIKRTKIGKWSKAT